MFGKIVVSGCWVIATVMFNQNRTNISCSATKYQATLWYVAREVPFWGEQALQLQKGPG